MRSPKRQVVPGYIGFDATASSLSMSATSCLIMLLRRLLQSGHKPIVVMGGGTTKLGDPSGARTQSRKLLTNDAIDANIASIRRCFERFLSFGDGPTG